MTASAARTSIRAIVVDDEPLARSSLAVLLRTDPEVEIVGECASGAQAVAAIRDLTPDAVFLDVEMPECDGFDVLELLGRAAPPAVVFVTAYDAYALRAFEIGALDYLLKPFDDERLGRALARVRERIAHAERRPAGPQVLISKSAGEVSFLKLADVDWIEAADYYSRVHIGSRAHLLRRSLTDLDGELDPNVFCRVHRCAIVKLERVRRLALNAGGEYDVLLDTCATVPLSRRYRKRLAQALRI